MSGTESLVDRAVAHVRDHIRANGLKVGDKLPGEAHFAAELGVSRAVMREAFGALAALRQIDVANGRRAKVCAIDGSVMANSMEHAVATAQVSIGDVWDVRRTLELATSALAARNRSDAAARRIVALAEEMAQADDRQDSLTALDIAFHQAIAEASGNALFFQIVRSFERLMIDAVPRAWSTRSRAEERKHTLEFHRDLAAAIAAQDPVAARTAMERHFDDSIGDLIKAAEPRSSAA